MGFSKRTRGVAHWALDLLNRKGLALGALVLGATLLLWAFAPSIRGQQRSSQRLHSAKLPQVEHEPENLVRLRQEWFFHQRAYPLGFIPVGLREKAIEQMNLMRQSVAESARAQVAPLVSTTWMPIGPQPTSGPFFGNTSGRVTALAVDRCDATAKTVYLGGADGGVWKSTDGGTTWTALTDTQPSLAVGSIALDPACTGSPSHTAAIYVGTGEENFAGDNLYGAGVFKSTDGGATWTVFGASAFPGTAFPITQDANGPYIGAIAVDPANSNIVLAAVRGSGSSFDEGIWRSTNGGNSWVHVLPVTAFNNIRATDVAFDPSDTTGGTAYAALGELGGEGSKNGVYKSTDAGMTWTALTISGFSAANFGRISLAIGPRVSGSTSGVLFAAIADASTFSQGLLGVFKSTNGGTTWTQFADPLVTPANGFCNFQCFYDLTIRVSSTNANLVFAGGAAQNAVLVRSTDGGTTWTEVSNNTATSTNGLHVDTHAIAFSANGSVVYTGNDGGVWATTNPVATPINWVNSNNNPLGITQFYSGHSIHPSSPLVSYGGTQDNGTQKYSGTTTWNDLGLGCDGGYTAVDTQVPSNVYGTCEYIPGLNGLLVIAKFFHNGDINSAILATFGIDGTDRGDFIAPVVIDPTNPQILYFGTFRVWQTTDGALDWQSISPDLTNGAGVLKTIAVAPNNSNVVYTGSDNGFIFATNNATAGSGASWSPAARAGLPNRVITHIAVDPHTPTTAYVTFSGFSGFNGDMLGHVFKTTTGGATWTDISSAPFSMSPVLPNIPVNALVVDPDDHSGNTLYAGTDIGVFVTSDGGVHWAPLGSGLPTAEVLSLALHEPSRTLRAATHGRSVWDFLLGTFIPSFNLASLSPVSANVNDPQAPLTLSVTGNGFTGSSVVQFNGAALTTTPVDANHLTATIPAASLMAAAAIPVTVKDASVSNTLPFPVLNPAPTLNSISPTTATAEVNLSLTVNGGSFVNGVNGTQVLLDGSGVPTVFNSATQVTANIPGSSLVPAGQHSIDVFNAQPGGGIETNLTASLVLNVNNPVPAATQLMPTNVNAGSGSFTLTVNGSGFVPSFPGQPGSTVEWNGSGRTTTFVSTSQLTAGIQASDVAASGSAMVTVFNPTPGGGTSAPALTFTINQVGDFSFGAGVSPSSRTVTAGQSATYTVPISGSGGFAGSVTLSCAGLPAASNCNSIVPNPVPAGSSAMMTVATTMRSVVPGAPSGRQRPWTIYCIGLLLAALLLLALAVRMREAQRRRLAFGLTLGLVAAFLALQIGCGGGGGGGGGGTPAGTYTITIVGQSGSLNHSTNVQLVVQ